MLEGNLTAVGVEVDTVVGSGIAVRGQSVIGTAGIIAGTLASVGTEEYTAGIDYTLGKLFVVLHLQDEVFGGVEVGEFQHLVDGIDEHKTAVVEGLDGNFLTG